MPNFNPPAGERSHPALTPSGQFDPWILWVTFRRCWPWAIPTGVVLACIAAFPVMYTFVPEYKASHLLEANQDYLVFDDVMPAITQLAKTEQRILLNPVVIDPVLVDPRILAVSSLSDPTTAETTLRKNLSVTSPGAATQMVISYVDADPVAAALVCNTVVESYMEKRLSLDTSRMNNLESWLDPEIERWEGIVKAKQEIVQDRSSANLGYDSEQRGMNPAEVGNLNALAMLGSEITSIRVELEVMKAMQTEDRPTETGDTPSARDESSAADIEFVPMEPSEVEIDAFVIADKAVQEAEGHVLRYKATLTDLEDQDRVRINREHYRDTESKRDTWAAKLETAKKDARQRAIGILKEYADAGLERRKIDARNQIAAKKAEYDAQRRQAITAELARRRNERESLQARMKSLQKEYDQQSAQERLRLEQIGASAADLQFAQAELSSAANVLTKLRDRQAAIRTERQSYFGAVRTVADATPPRKPMAEIPLVTMAGAGGVAFLVPFLVGLLWELKIQRLTDCAAVEKCGDLPPIVGEVAKLPGMQAARNRRVFEESIDTLRANLFLSMDTKHVRSIAVTSSMAGEGKSSVASQLAISIAKATGEPVLLIDADLRSPDQHQIFGLDNGVGLCGVLSGDEDFVSAVDKSLGELVHVLPAGHLSQSPHRILSPAAMRDMVDQATETYTHVVIDTAPVLSASETLAISSAVDATLVCVMRDVSRMDNVTRTTRRLEAAGATIAGTVFSGVPTRYYTSRYGDYQYALNDKTSG